MEHRLPETDGVHQTLIDASGDPWLWDTGSNGYRLHGFGAASRTYAEVDDLYGPVQVSTVTGFVYDSAADVFVPERAA